MMSSAMDANADVITDIKVEVEEPMEMEVLGSGNEALRSQSEGNDTIQPVAVEPANADTDNKVDQSESEKELQLDSKEIKHSNEKRITLKVKLPSSDTNLDGKRSEPSFSGSDIKIEEVKIKKRRKVKKFKIPPHGKLLAGVYRINGTKVRLKKCYLRLKRLVLTPLNNLEKSIVKGSPCREEEIISEPSTFTSTNKRKRLLEEMMMLSCAMDGLGDVDDFSSGDDEDCDPSYEPGMEAEFCQRKRRKQNEVAQKLNKTFEEEKSKLKPSLSQDSKPQSHFLPDANGRTIVPWLPNKNKIDARPAPPQKILPKPSHPISLVQNSMGPKGSQNEQKMFAALRDSVNNLEDKNPILVAILAGEEIGGTPKKKTQVTHNKQERNQAVLKHTINNHGYSGGNVSIGPKTVYRSMGGNVISNALYGKPNLQISSGIRNNLQHIVPKMQYATYQRQPNVVHRHQVPVISYVPQAPSVNTIKQRRCVPNILQSSKKPPPPQVNYTFNAPREIIFQAIPVQTVPVPVPLNPALATNPVSNLKIEDVRSMKPAMRAVSEIIEEARMMKASGLSYAMPNPYAPVPRSKLRPIQPKPSPSQEKEDSAKRISEFLKKLNNGGSPPKENGDSAQTKRQVSILIKRPDGGGKVLKEKAIELTQAQRTILQMKKVLKKVIVGRELCYDNEKKSGTCKNTKAQKIQVTAKERNQNGREITNKLAGETGTHEKPSVVPAATEQESQSSSLQQSSDDSSKWTEEPSGSSEILMSLLCDNAGLPAQGNGLIVVNEVEMGKASELSQSSNGAEDTTNSSSLLLKVLLNETNTNSAGTSLNVGALTSGARLNSPSGCVAKKDEINIDRIADNIAEFMSSLRDDKLKTNFLSILCNSSKDEDLEQSVNGPGSPTPGYLTLLDSESFLGMVCNSTEALRQLDGFTMSQIIMILQYDVSNSSTEDLASYSRMHSEADSDVQIIDVKSGQNQNEPESVDISELPDLLSPEQLSVLSLMDSVPSPKEAMETETKASLLCDVQKDSESEGTYVRVTQTSDQLDISSAPVGLQEMDTTPEIVEVFSTTSEELQELDTALKSLQELCNATESVEEMDMAPDPVQELNKSLQELGNASEALVVPNSMRELISKIVTESIKEIDVTPESVQQLNTCNATEVVQAISISPDLLAQEFDTAPAIVEGNFDSELKQAHELDTALSSVQELATKLNHNQVLNAAVKGEQEIGSTSEAVRELPVPELDNAIEVVGEMGTPDLTQELNNSNEVVQETEIPSNIVQETDIVSDLMQESNIASDIVQETDITSDSVQETDIVSDLVQESNVASDIVQETDITSDSVQETDIVSDLVQESNVASDLVKETDIASDSVQETDIVLDSVHETEIVLDLVKKTDIALDLVQELDLATETTKDSLTSKDSICEKQNSIPLSRSIPTINDLNSLRSVEMPGCPEKVHDDNSNADLVDNSSQLSEAKTLNPDEVAGFEDMALDESVSSEDVDPENTSRLILSDSASCDESLEGPGNVLKEEHMSEEEVENSQGDAYSNLGVEESRTLNVDLDDGPESLDFTKQSESTSGDAGMGTAFEISDERTCDESPGPGDVSEEETMSEEDDGSWTFKMELDDSGPEDILSLKKESQESPSADAEMADECETTPSKRTASNVCASGRDNELLSEINWDDSSKDATEQQIDTSVQSLPGASSHVVTQAGLVQCFHCDKLCSSPHSLYGHAKVMHLPKTEPFECCMCGVSNFKRRRSLHKHYLARHINKLLQVPKKVYICKYCPKTFITKPGLTGHENVHSGNTPYECEVCQKKFPSSSHLSKHRENVHRPQTDHVCPSCGKVFRKKRSLVKHNVIHANERLYKCSVCSKGFNYKKNLLKHYFVHDTTRYMCPVCEMTFSKKPEMRSHVKIAHKPQHECPSCSKCFERKTELQKHSKVHQTTGGKRKATKKKHPTRKKKRKGANKSKKSKK